MGARAVGSQRTPMPNPRPSDRFVSPCPHPTKPSPTTIAKTAGVAKHRRFMSHLLLGGLYSGKSERVALL